MCLFYCGVPLPEAELFVIEWIRGLLASRIDKSFEGFPGFKMRIIHETFHSFEHDSIELIYITIPVISNSSRILPVMISKDLGCC
jgi:hypothetical protein